MLHPNDQQTQTIHEETSEQSAGLSSLLLDQAISPGPDRGPEIPRHRGQARTMGVSSRLGWTIHCPGSQGATLTDLHVKLANCDPISTPPSFNFAVNRLTPRSSFTHIMYQRVNSARKMAFWCAILPLHTPFLVRFLCQNRIHST